MGNNGAADVIGVEAAVDVIVDKAAADVIGIEAAKHQSYEEKLRFAQRVVQKLRAAGVECKLGDLGH